MTFLASSNIVNMFTTTLYPVLIAIAVALSSFIYLLHLRSQHVDPGEPPIVSTRIPFIGHMIGLLRHHNNYFTMLSERYTGPVFTVKIFSFRIYIVQSPELAQAAFKQSKEIDFDTFKVWGCKALAYDEHATGVVAFKPEKGGGCYMSDLHIESYASLAQGRSLLETNARVLNYLARSLNSISTCPERHWLFRWLRDEYTIGSAEALFGLPNPVSEDKGLIQSIWDFERDLGLLVLDFYPALTAPKGNAARKVVTPAFEKYYDAGLSKNAGGLVAARERVGRRWGLTTKAIAQADMSIIMAAGTNTVPNVFYGICNVFSQPELVKSLRVEVEGIINRRTRDGNEVVALDIARMQSDCPLLTACFHETMRLTKTGASVRTILQDVMLNDQYLLKKGAFLQIPTGVLQSDTRTWGPDAKQFSPYRWLNQDSLSKEAKKARSHAYVPFGGGKNLCPGRHLAFTEILAFIAMLVYGFEISMSDGGKMVPPKGEFQKLGVASISPERDLDITIKRRKEFEGVMWEFDVGNI